MVRLLWLAAMLVATPAPSSAAPRDARSAETERVMRGFIHLNYQLHDIAAVHAAYTTPDYIQHNPDEGAGEHSDAAFIATRGIRDPEHFRPIGQWVDKLDHTMVDGEYFAIHHRLYTSPQDTGRVFFDIWRVAAGKIVEHWDVIQPIPAEAKNANGMVGDLAPSRPPRRGEPSPLAVIRAYMRVGLDEGDPARAAKLYIAQDLRQHSPHIAEGKAALTAYFAAKPPAQPGAYSRVSHILADGDLVLVTRHTGANADDPGRMYADLFRVVGGKITEHWDVIQPVPPGARMW